MALSNSTEDLTQNVNVQPPDHQSEISSGSTMDPASHLHANLDESQLPSEDTVDSGIQSLNAQVPDQSSDPSRSTEKIEAVSPFNIQKLDQSKIKFYIVSKQEKSAKSDLKSLSERELVDKFIDVYNNTNDKRNTYKKIDSSYEDDSVLVVTYNCRKSVVPRAEKALLQNPKKIYLSNFILFFFLKNDDGTIKNIFAATNFEAWKVVRPCGDSNFPIKIIDRISSPDKIIVMERRHLFGNFIEKKTRKGNRDIIKEELYYTSSLLYLVENLVSEVDKSKERGAELFNLLKNFTEILLDDSTTDNEQPNDDDSENEDSEGLQSSAISSNPVDESEDEQSDKIVNEQIEYPSPPGKKKKEESSIVKKRKKNTISFRIKITTAGSVSILKQIPTENVIPTTIEIIKLFNNCLFDSTPIDKKFDFLYFFKASRVLQPKLDDALIEHIFERFQSGDKPHVDVQHKYYNDYFLSDKYEIKVKGKKHFNVIGSEAPDIDTIIEEIDTTDLETFRDEMKSGQLRFYDREGKKQDEPFINYLEAELFYENENYFKFRKIWYQINVDYLSLLQQDFEKVMDKLFIKKGDEGSLPKIWYKNDHVTEANINEILKYGSGIRKLMKKLEEARVHYVSNDKVMQNELIGEILKVNIIKEHKNEIEATLKQLPDSCSEKAFKTVFEGELKSSISEDDLTLIWKELTRERKIIQENSKGKKRKNKEKNSNDKPKKFVANPFPYPLKGDLDEKFKPKANKKSKSKAADQLKSIADEKDKLLKDYLYELCGLHQREEDYNRSYVIDPSSKLDTEEHEYIVFDQILPDGIESCDVLRYTKNTLYLYHIKEVLGQHTREVCSQIINAAINIHEALRTNQTDNYLKSLWNFASVQTQEKWKKVSKSRLEEIGEDEFMDMFRKKNIVFIYAYRTPSGFRKSNEREELPEFMNDVCKKFEFLNESGYLTSKFFHTKRDDFVNAISKDSRVENTDCKAAYKVLKSRQFSESTIAKMEVIRLAEKLINFRNRFDFKICEIPIK